MLLFIRIIFFIIFFGLALFAFVSFDFNKKVFEPIVLEQPIEFTIEQGETALEVFAELKRQGLVEDETYFKILVKLQKPVFKAGEYRLEGEYSLVEILALLDKGKVTQEKITIIEGWNFKQFRKAIESHPHIKQTLKDLSDQEIMARLGMPNTHPEGWFYPDTYVFARGSEDFIIYKKAFTMMQEIVNETWERRESNLPLKSAYEMLILASIIEKETGKAAERPIIASVFINRLNKDMKLQTDPTVIYGMGENYDGDIRRKDLTTDTPYNTYTRKGLTPTPIALPSKAAIYAAVHPDKTDYLFFVAKGQQGEHYFSETYQEHLKAVKKYQLNQ